MSLESNRNRKSDPEIVLNVLNRTHPHYIPGYAITKLGEIYEGRRLSLAALYDQLHNFLHLGVIDRKELTVEELNSSIESLIETGRIKNDDLRLRNVDEYISMSERQRRGYRLTEKGKRARIEETSPESTYRGIPIPEPVPV